MSSSNSRVEFKNAGSCTHQQGCSGWYFKNHSNLFLSPSCFPTYIYIYIYIYIYMHMHSSHQKKVQNVLCNVFLFKHLIWLLKWIWIAPNMSDNACSISVDRLEHGAVKGRAGIPGSRVLVWLRSSFSFLNLAKPPGVPALTLFPQPSSGPLPNGLPCSGLSEEHTY